MIAAYKSFDDYRIFHDGYAESLLTKTFTTSYLYLAKVKLAMQEKIDEGKRSL